MPIRLFTLAAFATMLAVTSTLAVEVVVSDQNAGATPPSITPRGISATTQQAPRRGAQQPTLAKPQGRTRRSAAAKQIPVPARQTPTPTTTNSPPLESPAFSEYPTDFGTVYDGGAVGGGISDGSGCSAGGCSGCDSCGGGVSYGGGCSGGCSGGGCSGGCGGGNGGLLIDFWLSQGYTYNGKDPTNGFNLPVTYNDRADEYMMNQMYLALGQEVNTNGGWDIGGRADILYGTDYFFTTSTGLETHLDGSPRWNSEDGPRSTGASMYGLALPQLYVDLFAPIGNGIRFKIGHFYTTIGYESVMAPENFFYSHSYTMQYAEPFTHTGVLAEFNSSGNLTWHAGMTQGWDTFEDNNNDLGILAGFNWSNDVSSIGLTAHTGNEDDAGLNNRTMYSLVYTRNIGCKFRYIMQHDFGMEENAEINTDGQAEVAKWYGLNQYFLMDLSDSMTLGMRVEWFRDQDNARVLAIPIESQVQGGNYAAVTAGFNWRMGDHWTLRPEARWDWSDVSVPSAGRNGMFNDFREDNQFTMAADLILKF